MRKENTNMNDKRFEELLEKALAGSITEEEEKELLQDYIKPETAEVFPFIQLACDHKYLFPDLQHHPGKYGNGSNGIRMIHHRPNRHLHHPNLRQ